MPTVSHLLFTFNAIFFPFIHHRERMGNGIMIETSKNPKCPKVGFKIYMCNRNAILIFSLLR